MALRGDALIPEPCPVAWAEMRGGDTERFCERCSKAVHDLSGLDEAALRGVAAGGASMCVQLLVDADGAIVFPAIVPVSRLRAPAIAATTFAALVACTPHERPYEPIPEAEGVIGYAAPPLLPQAPAPPPPRTFRLGGALRGPSSAVPVGHELSAAAVPCDTLPASTHGRPSDVDGTRTLLDDREVAKADLLARCEP